MDKRISVESSRISVNARLLFLKQVRWTCVQLYLSALFYGLFRAARGLPVYRYFQKWHASMEFEHRSACALVRHTLACLYKTCGSLSCFPIQRRQANFTWLASEILRGAKTKSTLEYLYWHALVLHRRRQLLSFYFKLQSDVTSYWTLLTFISRWIMTYYSGSAASRFF